MDKKKTATLAEKGLETSEIGLQTIEEGRFASMLDEQIRQTCRRFVAQMKADGAGKGKAQVLARITLELADGTYTVVSEVGAKLPYRPVGASTAVAREAGRDKQLTLFALEADEAASAEEAA